MVAKALSDQKYENVEASPVKSFFVSMLTRDITLNDAMLDLLDNCVDGILRKRTKLTGEKPYKGFKAEITFNKDSFSIHDNCGGIPWDLHQYAFRMGRANGRTHDPVGTVGVYGIGMKRAIFKMGRNCLISTQCKKDNYEIEISKKWMNNESDWSIPVRVGKKSMTEDGTTIVVGDLLPGISNCFGPDNLSYTSDFITKVETHYAFIINKGFDVIVNGKKVIPKPIDLHFNDSSKQEKSIRPFIYKATVDEVDVFLAVGFSRPLPSKDDVESSLEERRYSTDQAGWTVVCNDRAVLYCDKSELTGWGEAGVPQYHTQFIAISGIVEFTSNNPSKLPTTTTKRGIDSNSQLYLQIKNKMREGMKMFIDYTNKWKTREKESREQIKNTKAIPLTVFRHSIANTSIKFTKVSSKPGGMQYKPELPTPPLTDQDSKKISFSKTIREIKVVSSYLFDDDDIQPSKIGESCFDRVYKEARK